MWIVGILIDAAILGIVIAAMDIDRFTRWGALIGCVLVVGITANVVGMLLPGLLSLLAIVAAAIVGGAMISWLYGVSTKRGATAAGIYLAIRIVIALLWRAIL